MRTGAADLEAAQIVAAKEEPVDDLLLLPKVEQIADAAGYSDPPVTVAGEMVQRNEVLPVDVGAHEVGIAAQAGKIRAHGGKVAGVRVDLAVAVVQSDR